MVEKSTRREKNEKLREEDRRGEKKVRKNKRGTESG